MSEEGQPPPPAPIGPRDARIGKHIRRLSEASEDPAKFAEALRAFRDDVTLSAPQRDAIFKTLAQDAALGYFVLVTGKPLDLKTLLGPPEDE
ncbi:MAG: hypothetical protein IPK13_20430 [Deltaproteobacteria bacterium]|nr:hypothetical protein [Deltaproteobacteria bacterium]